MMPNAGDPFMRLIGSTFGVDFSPVADALRVAHRCRAKSGGHRGTGATITATSFVASPRERPSGAGCDRDRLHE